jgi:transcriptional regulator with XRE-family HTH domain
MSQRITVPDPIRLEPADDPETFTELRRRLGLSQGGFARRYGVPLMTLLEWDRGRRLPGAATRAYLTVIARDPERVAAVLAGATAADLAQQTWRALRQELDDADRREDAARRGADDGEPDPSGERPR